MPAAASRTSPTITPSGSGSGLGPAGFGPYHPAARTLVDGVDLLIHDAQYTPAEFAVRADFGHSAIDHAVGLADAGAVGSLLRPTDGEPS